MRVLPVSPWYVAILSCLFLLLMNGFEASAQDGNGPVGGAFVSDAQADLLDAPRPRDPFWPVGYVPKKVVRVKEKAPSKSAGSSVGRSQKTGGCQGD